MVFPLSLTLSVLIEMIESVAEIDTNYSDHRHKQADTNPGRSLEVKRIRIGDFFPRIPGIHKQETKYSGIRRNEYT